MFGNATAVSLLDVDYKLLKLNIVFIIHGIVLRVLKYLSMSQWYPFWV